MERIMTQYILQSLNIKTNAVTKKTLVASGKGSVKAQFGTQYLVVDAETGRAPKKQVLRKKGKDLIIEVDGVQVGIIRGFYEDAANKEAPTYRVDDFCSLDDAKSLEASNKEGKYELVVGGTGEGSAYAAGDGIVWHEDASKCIYQPTDPAELAATASEGLTQQQLLLGGLGALLVGGGAVAIGSSSGGGSSGSASTPPPAAPQLTNVADDVPGIVGNLQSGALTNDNKPTLTFTAQPGSTVNVYDNGVLLGVAIEGPAGTFTLTPGAALADGVHSFTATATNAGGTSAPTAAFTLNIDTIGGGSLPGLNIPDAPLGVNNTEAANGVELVITLPPDAVEGEVVTSVITDPNGRVITLTTTLTAADVKAGTITQTVPLTDLKPGTAYLDGRWDTSTTVGDLAGNTGPAQIGSFNLAANAPSLSLNTIAGDDIVNAVEKQGAVAVTGNTSAEPGQTVTITVTGPNGTNLTYYAAVLPNGTFSTDIPANIMASLADGSYTLTANVSNVAGTPAVAASKTLAIDIVAPTVTITHVAGADNVFNAAERGYDATTNTLSSTVPTPPIISGTTDAEPGQTVTVLIDGQSYSATVIAGNGGLNTWSVQVSQATAKALIHGTTYPVSASVKDLAGNPSTPDSDTLSVNIAPPDVPTVKQNLSGTDTPTVTGTAQKLDGSNNPIALANGDVLTFTLNGVTVIATIDSTAVSGTSNPGVSYDPVTKAWALNTTTATESDGDVIDFALQDGTYNVGVSVATGGSTSGRSDISTGELVINTVPPTLTLNAVSPDADGDSVINASEQNQTVALTGTTNAEPGQTVTISGLGNSTYTAVVQAGANGLNTFSVQVPGSDIAQLGDGTLQLQASVTNRFGLSGNDTETVLVDTTAPSAPAVALTESPLGVSAAEAASSGGTPLVLTLPTNAQVGDVVTSVITKPDGSILTLTHTILASELPAAQGGTATGSGPFAITQNIPTAQLNVDGTWSTSTTITDTNGNTSQPGTGNFVLDTQGPGQPAVALPEAANGVNAAEAASLGGTPLVVTLPTNAAVGDTVTSIITKPDGSTLTLTSVLTAADISAGTVSQLIPTSALTVDGAWTTSTTIADVAGNTSPARAGGFTLDTTPPAAPVADVAAASDTGVSNTDNNISDTTPTISGTGTAGDTITVTFPNGEVLTVVVASDGTWSVTPTGALADGLHNVLVTATDPAGNTSPATTVPVRIDTSAPATPAAPDLVASSDTGNSSTDDNTSDNTPTFSGTGTAGDTITVYDGNTVLGTAVVDGNGNWSLNVPASMADGVHQITTTASDPAGNTSGRSPALAVTIDTQAPAAPPADVAATSDTGSSDTDNITSDNTPTITGGSATPGDTITLKDAAGNTLGSAVVAPDGTWAITPTSPLADGTQNLSVTATDPAGNVSAPGTVPVTIDTTPPAAPAAALAVGSNSGLTTDNVTNDNTPTITGSGATPGDTITLYAPDGTTELGTAVVASNGTWSITPTTALADGTQALSVKATDPAGNVSPATPLPLVIDTTVAAPVISPTNGAVISGTGEPGATVTLTDGINTIGTAVVAADGTWSITPPNNTAVPLNTVLSATQTDVAGNPSTPGTGTVTAVPFVNPTDGSPITGTGKPGDSIVVSYPDPTNAGQTITLPAVVVAPDGTWSVTPGAGQIPANGATVTATDTTSNLSATGIVDQTAPNAPAAALADSSNSGSLADTLTNDNTPTISGTGATPGETITLKSPTGTVLGTAVVAANGTWAITPTATLADGAYTGANALQVTATDKAGNTSQPTSVPVTIDTQGPSAPAADVATLSDTGADSDDNITSVNTPEITGGGATPGDTITLKDANGNVLGTDVVAADGTWSITPTNALPDGTQTLKVTATDPAGNTSAPTTLPVTIDTMAPAAPAAILDPASDSGIAGDSITRVTRPVISGSGATPGDTMTLYAPDGTTVLGTAQVDEDGNWAITPNAALAEGPNALEVTATDPAGNESAPTTVPVTVDTTVPAAPAADVAASSDTGSSNTDNITSDNTPTITGGGATPGDTITLNGPNGTSLGTAVVAADGSWSITPTTSLPDGTQNLAVTATDPQGNTGPATSVPVTIDTTAGTPTGALATASDTGTPGDNLTKNNTPVLSGTADANAAISVLINGKTYTTTANGSGAWSIDLATAIPTGASAAAPALADGRYTPVITATDPAGNSITANGTAFTVDATPPAAPAIAPTNGTLITGSGEPGAVVTVKDAANNVIGTATVAADGTWSLDPATDVPNGTVLNATQADPAGNVSALDTETVDTTLPDAPVIAQANGSAVNGTGEPGATIALTLADGTVLRDAGGAPLTVTVQPDGTWSATPGAALADGAVVKATQTVTHNGNLYTAYDTETVDAMPPAAPAADVAAASDTGSSNTDNITSDTTPDISGAGATPGDTITLKAPNGDVLGTVTVAPDGSWSITPNRPLAEGPQNLTVTAADPAGNVSAPTTVPVTIDTGIANPTGGLASASDTGTLGDNKTNDTTPALSGTAEPGAAVEVTVGGVTYTTTAGSDGAWSIPATNTLADGSYTPSIKVTDAAGNTVTTNGTPFTVDATAPSTPTLTSAYDNVTGGAYNATATNNLTNGGVTNDAQPTLTFTAEAGSTVKVYDGTTLLGTATEGPTGTFSFTPAAALSEGAHSFTATATDAAGNTSGATTPFNTTIDTQAPATPGALAVPENTNGGVNAAEVVSGGGVPVSVPLTTTGANAVQAGDVITLTVDDPTTNAPIAISYTVTAADITAGTASVLVPSASIPVDGTYNLSATITDPAGNTSPASTGSFTVDKSAPAAGTGALASVSDTGTVGDNTTNDSTPVLSGTAEAGSTVEVTVNGNTYLVTPTGTTWTLDLETAIPVGATAPATALPDGNHTPTIKVTDAAGNSTTSTGTAFVVDASAPLAPTVSNLLSNDATPTLTGTAILAAGEKLTVQVNGASYTIDPAAATQPTGVSYNSGTGVWSIDTGTAVPTSGTLGSLTDGSYPVTATATDAAGNATADATTNELTIDTTVAAPVISPTNGAVISGTGEPGATVTLTDGTTTLGTATVAADGSWSFTPTTPLADGTALSATQTDVSGNVSSPDAETVNSAMPDVNPTNGTVITGTGKPGDTIALTLTDGTPILGTNGQPISVTVASNGTWSATPQTPLVDGTVVKATDTTSGLSTTETVDAIAPATPTIDLAPASDSGVSNSDDLTNDTTPTLTGTGEAGSTITIFDGATPVGTAVVAADGTWTATLTTPLTEGLHNLTATAIDKAGNTSDPSSLLPVTIDTTGPSAPATAPDMTAATDTGASSTDNNTANPKPAFVIGALPAGTASAVLFVDGVAVPATYDAATGTLTPTGPIADGNHNITYAFADAAGNAGTPSPQLPITIDTTAPTAPPAPDLQAASDTGASSTDNTTSDTTPTFTVPTGQANVILLVDGAPVAATYDPATGAITPNTPLPEGTHDIAIQTVDTAGNTSPASTALPVTIDTTAPAAPTAAPDMTAATDSGTSSTDNLTKDSTPDFNIGTLPAGTTPVLLVDGAQVPATVTTDANGNTVLTPTTALTDGAHNISYAYTDPAGNTSAASPALAVSIDTGAPAAPAAALAVASNSGLTTDNITSDNTPTITGTGATPGNTITLYKPDGTTVLGTAVVAANGSWSITSTTLADGTQNLKVSATDPAGNESTKTPVPVVIDTTAPAAPTVTAALTDDTTPTISGAATLAAGEKLTVQVNGATYTIDPAATTQPAGISYNSGTGAWSVDTATAVPTSGTLGTFPDGRYPVTATTTDAAGNATSDASTNELRIDTTSLTVALTSPNGTTYTNDTTPVITGQVAGVGDLANTPVTVTVGGATYTVLPDASGNFSIDTATTVPTSGTFGTSGALPDGSYTVKASVTSPTGVVNSDTDTLAVDTTAPVITITRVAGDDVDNDSGTPAPANGTFDLTERGFDENTYLPASTVTTLPVISGTTDAPNGQTVTVTLNGKTYTTTASGGTWSVTATQDDAKLLNHGTTYTLTASVTDLAGNTGTDVNNGLTVSIAPPDVPTVVSQTTGSTTPTITGLAEKKVVFAATESTAGADGVSEVQIITNPALVANRAVTFKVGSTVITTAALDATPTVTALVALIKADAGYDSAPFTVDEDATGTLSIFWKGNGAITDVATLTQYSPLATDDQLEVTLKEGTTALTGGTYTLTVGGTSSPAGLTYNTTTGAWSLAVPAGVLTAPTTAPLTYNVDVSSTAGGITRSDISAGELVIVAPPSIVTEPTGQSWTNEVWGSTSSGGVVLNVGEASDGTTVRVSIDGTGAQAGQVVSVQWDTQTATESPLLTAANIAAGYIDVLVPKATLQAATPANTRETLNVTPRLLSGPGGSTISTGAAVAATVDFIVPAAPAINAATGATTSALSGIQEAVYDKNLTAFQTNATTLGTYGQDNALYYSEFWNGGNSPGTVVRIQLPALKTDSNPTGSQVGDTLTLNWSNQRYEVPTKLTSEQITARFVDVTVPTGTIADAGYGTITVNATLTSVTSGNTSATQPVNVNVVYDQPLFDLARNADGFQIDGRSASEFTGQKLVTVGDVNGDGYDDIGVMGQLASGTQAAYVVYGKPGVGEVDLSNFTAPTKAEGFMIVAPGSLWSTFGYNNQPTWKVPYLDVGVEVTGGGDINGDGLADMVVSSPDSLAGKTFVIFGRTSGSAVIDLSAINAAGVSTDGFTIDRGKVQAESIRLLGDINGDGIDDIAIDNVEPYALDTFNSQRNGRDQNTTPLAFAPTANANISTPAFVLYGRSTWDNTDTLALTSLAASDGTTIAGQVQGVGDFNGDGINDMLFSNGQMLLGGGKGSITISGMPTAFVGEGMGDVNGDGLADVIVFNNQAGYLHSNTYANANGGWWWNDAYVIYGSKTPVSFNVTTMDSGVQTAGFHIRPNFNGGSGDGVISSAAVAGDINGDGYADVLVSMTSGTGTSVDGIVRGETYVIYGGPTGSKNYASAGGGFFSLQRALAPSEGFRINGACSGDASGTFVSPAGDINGDGFDDLLVSSRAADPHGVISAGTSYVVFGGRDDYTDYMVFQGSNGDLISSVGTTTNDVLTGTSVSNQIVAGDGDDVIIGNGGADVMYGGRGNDTFVINADNVTNLARTTNSPQDIARIDGGYGIDTVKLDGAGITLDMSAIPDVAIQSVEAFDLSGTGKNYLVVTLSEILQISGINNFNTANGYVAVAGQVPPNWSTTNHQNQIKVDSDGDDYLLFADGQFSVVGRVTETATGKVYRVYQSSQAAAQVLVADTVLTQPVVQFTGTESADGLISVADRDSDGGTTIRVLIDGTGARVGDVLRLNYGGQDVDVTITAIPTDGYITVTVPTASLLAETPAGTSETVSMTAELMRSGASLIASNPASVDVNFIAPTAPTINNTAWAATGAGNTSDLSGIGEAKYATNSTTHATTGTADNALYVSETWDNGTVVRVQLPATGSVPPAAGDTVLVNWGSATGAANKILTATDINNKYVDITVPFSKLETQAFGNVTVTAQIKNAAGNLSAASPVASVNWVYDVAAGQLATNPQYGFAINGQLASDYAGWSISNAGDVNGDGYEDLVIGAMQNDASGSNAGRAYVLFGNSTGAYSNFDLSNLTVAGNSNGFVINAPAIANAWYGWSVSGGGDINGDGLADVVIGNNTNYASTATSIRPLDVNASGAGGPSYVVFGRSATTTVQLSSLSVASNTNGFMVSSPFANGYSVTDAGDVNGDGLSDLAVTAPSYNGRAGVAYVVYGKTSGAPVVTASSNFVNSTEGFVINGGTVDGTVAALTSVSSGDINGDGLSDLVLGGWYTGTSTGSVYVVYGSSAIGARPMVDLSSLTSASNTLGFRIVGESSTGVSVAGAADINGDGLDDVLLQSTAGYAGTNTNQGVAWVAFGKKDGAAVNVSAIEAGTASGFAINLGITSGVHGAFWIDSAGDINGDGLGDIIVSHAYGNLSPTAAGAAYVVFGKTGTGMVNVASLAASDGFRILGACANDYLGMRVTGAGDVNGDGFDDIAVSAPYADPAGRTDAGMTYIVYGGASAYRSSVFQASNGDMIGTSGNDTLTGTSGNNQLVGGDGNDTLTGAGGADAMYGGRGDDVFVLDSDNLAKLALTGTSQNILRVDGGTGIDTIKIDGTGQTTNLATLPTGFAVPDPSIAGLNLPTPPAAGWQYLDPQDPSLMLRGQYWSTTNPSGRFELGTMGFYGLTNDVPGVALKTDKVLQLCADPGDDNASINITQRAGELIRVTFAASNHPSNTKNFIDVYWGDQLIRTVSNIPSGNAVLVTIDLPVSSTVAINKFTMVGPGTGSYGTVMGNFKITSNMIELPPLTTAVGSSVVLKDLPVGATLTDGVNSVAIVDDDPGTTGVNESTRTIDVTNWDQKKLALTVANVQDTPSYVNGSKTIVYSITDVQADGSTVTNDVSYIVGSTAVPSLPTVGTPLDLITDVERIDLGNHNSGTGNTLSIGLKNVLQMSSDDVFNTTNGWTQSSTGWTQVSATAPTAWGATNHGNQMVVDGGTADMVVVDGAFIQAGTVTHTENGVTSSYKVLQSVTAQAQILVNSNIKLKLQPTIYAGLGELGGMLTEGEALSGGGTMVRIAVTDIGAVAGNQIQLGFGKYSVLSDALSQADIDRGWVEINVPTNIIYQNVQDQVSGQTIPMYAQLVTVNGNGAMSVLNDGPTVQQPIDFVSPTPPIIDATAWSTTNLTSDTSGIVEAKYEINWAMATSATGTPATSGSADGGIYVSEALSGGSTVHVKLPNGTTPSSLRPPVAGDKVLVTWGNATPIEVVLSATDITNKYVNVNVPFSTIDAQGYGTSTVTAQIVLASNGNRSDAAKVDVNYLYELPLALISGGTQGFVINGSTSAGETGFSVASAGDVNGDGLEDVIIGARREDNNKGRAYVVFGKTDNTAIDLTAVLAGSGGFVISSLSKSDSYTGYDVYGAGDINGDGLADLLVSVPDFNSSASGPGDVFVVYGKADTAAVQLSDITGGQSTGFRISGVSATAQGQLGQSLAAAGDMNGDGIGDFIIAQPGQGKAYVVYGRQDNATINITAVANGDGGYAITGLTGGSNYWDANVGAGGDVNGDGLADVVIGDGNINNTNNRAFVVFGSTNNPGSFVGTAVGTRGFIIQGATATGSKLGDHVTIVDDFNGDGLADVVVSDEARRVYVVYGKASNTTVALGASSVDATGAAGFTILTNDAADTVGSLMAKNVLVSSAGDFNGDGLTDLLIGVPTGDPYGRADAGRSYLVYGRTGGVSISTDNMAFSDGFRIIGESAGDYSGFAISAAGDVNGDGFADLVMGAYGTDYGSQIVAGKSYVIFGGIDRVTKTSAIDFLGTSAGETLNGTNTTSGLNEQFIAGAGNDTLIGGGGADVMYGGAGNDTFVLNADNAAMLARNTGNASQDVARIDGGTGLDKIVLDGGGITLDLTAIKTDVISNIEQIDISGSGANTLKLNLTDVLDMGQSNVFNVDTAAIDTRKQLMITADDSTDKVILTDLANWTQATGGSATFAQDGHTYAVYNHNTSQVQLLIDQLATLSSS